MKKLILAFLVVAASAATPELVTAQKYSSLDKSPADIAYYRPGGRNAVPIAKVVYNRPQKNGREMIGGTEPFGKVWRLGANEATEIKFYKDVTFGGKSIPEGTYSMYAIPNPDKWTIIVNKKLDTWGAFSYDESMDVARVDVPVEKPAQELEAFSITFDDGKMFMGWENHQVVVPVQ